MVLVRDVDVPERSELVRSPVLLVRREVDVATLDASLSLLVAVVDASEADLARVADERVDLVVEPVVEAERVPLLVRLVVDVPALVSSAASLVAAERAVVEAALLLASCLLTSVACRCQGASSQCSGAGACSPALVSS